MDEPTWYTHAEWRVIPGREEEFVEAWRALSEAFAALPARPLWGTLLRSEQEPSLFYSFGPWAAGTDIAAMRNDPSARLAIERVAELCERATPSTYREVLHVDLRTSS